jgi:hypothetical protein
MKREFRECKNLRIVRPSSNDWNCVRCMGYCVSRLAAAGLAVILIFNSTYAQSTSTGCTRPPITKEQKEVGSSKSTGVEQEKPKTSDRELEGLKGLVRRVYTESAKITNKDGKLEEGKRVLLEDSIYDKDGRKIESRYMSNPGGAMENIGRDEFKYDEDGNTIEMTIYAKDNSILHKEKYEYEFDPSGNWTKMTIKRALIEQDKLWFEPTEVVYRRIAYYFSLQMISPQLNQKKF